VQERKKISVLLRKVTLRPQETTVAQSTTLTTARITLETVHVLEEEAAQDGEQTLTRSAQPLLLQSRYEAKINTHQKKPTPQNQRTPGSPHSKQKTPWQPEQSMRIDLGWSRKYSVVPFWESKAQLGAHAFSASHLAVSPTPPIESVIA
jgi:hypothetical protein